jgi:hypothetical protein
MTLFSGQAMTEQLKAELDQTRTALTKQGGHAWRGIQCLSLLGCVLLFANATVLIACVGSCCVR